MATNCLKCGHSADDHYENLCAWCDCTLDRFDIIRAEAEATCARMLDAWYGRSASVEGYRILEHATYGQRHFQALLDVYTLATREV